MKHSHVGPLSTLARWGRGRHAVLAAVLWLVCAVAVPAAAQKPGATRIALVIGNGAYASVSRLANPGNDAKLVAGSLKASGFTLIGGDAHLDLDKTHFDRAVAEFGHAIASADVALFYYSGHGLQVDGTNFLVPVDANPGRRQDLDFQMVSADLVLRQMSGSGTKLNILILDACRNNPFEGGGLRAVGGGLAEMKAPEGTLISYATQPGAVARDGAGRDSPFTLALVDAIHQPGLDIFRLFNRVGVEVKKTTGGEQQPWLSASPIEGEFSFVAAPPPPAPVAPPAVTPAPVAAAPAPTPPAAAAPAPPTPVATAPVATTAAEPAPADAATADTKKLAGGKPGPAASGRPAQFETAALMPPAALPAPIRPPPAIAPERPGAGFRCPAKDSFVFGEDEVFDWSGDAVTVRRVTSSWSWRALGSDPANPNLCLRSGNNGVLHRLVGWFDVDKIDFSESPERPMLAMLQGQAAETSIRHWSHRAPASGTAAVYETHWRLHGHESFTLAGRAYDTLVFDLSETSSRTSSSGTGRVWYAPALGLFVRRVWRGPGADDVVGFSVVGVSATGSGDSRGEGGQ